MDDRVAKVRELLHEAAEAHHYVFRIVDGADDDWRRGTRRGQLTARSLQEVLRSARHANGANLVRRCGVTAEPVAWPRASLCLDRPSPVGKLVLHSRVGALR